MRARNLPRKETKLRITHRCPIVMVINLFHIRKCGQRVVILGYNEEPIIFVSVFF